MYLLGIHISRSMVLACQHHTLSCMLPEPLLRISQSSTQKLLSQFLVTRKLYSLENLESNSGNYELNFLEKEKDVDLRPLAKDLSASIISSEGAFLIKSPAFLSMLAV